MILELGTICFTAVLPSFFNDNTNNVGKNYFDLKNGFTMVLLNFSGFALIPAVSKLPRKTRLWEGSRADSVGVWCEVIMMDLHSCMEYHCLKHIELWSLNNLGRNTKEIVPWIFDLKCIGPVLVRQNLLTGTDMKWIMGSDVT